MLVRAERNAGLNCLVNVLVGDGRVLKCLSFTLKDWAELVAVASPLNKNLNLTLHISTEG
jgi:hypothetical protein